MEPSRLTHTFNDAYLLETFNLLAPLSMNDVNSRFADVHQATALSWSGLSMNYTTTSKIGFYKTRADSFLSTSSPGNDSSLNASNVLRVVVSKDSA